MKAEIDEKGQMTITAETPIEAYALRQWCREAFMDLLDGTRLDGETCVWRGSALIANAGFGAR